MYAFHLQQADALRSDAMIYSPDVPVFRDDEHRMLEAPFKVAFLSAGACDARDVAPLDQPKIPGAMSGRIIKVLGAVQANGHDALVLGAWSCGDFANDPALIAELFLTGPRRPLQGGFPLDNLRHRGDHVGPTITESFPTRPLAQGPSRVQLRRLLQTAENRFANRSAEEVITGSGEMDVERRLEFLQARSHRTKQVIRRDAVLLHHLGGERVLLDD